MSEALNMRQLPEAKLLTGIFQTSCASVLNEQI